MAGRHESVRERALVQDRMSFGKCLAPAGWRSEEEARSSGGGDGRSTCGTLPESCLRIDS